MATPLPTYPPETQVKIQCLKVSPEFPDIADSIGTVIFDGRQISNGRYIPETFLREMVTGHSLKITGENESFNNFVVSLNKNMVAFNRVMINANDRITQNEIALADAAGQIQMTTPWEADWLALLQWTDDQRLLLAYDQPITTTDGYPAQASYLVLNPATDDRQIISPDYPNFLDLTNAWGWQGVVYDPALTRAVYGWQYMDGDEEMYTLGLWDTERHQLITTMEDYYAYYPVFKSETPLPRWALDGSKFAFRGQFLASRADERVTIELYQADRDGQVNQLTHFGLATSYLPGRSFSWSPDGRYIAMYLEDWYDVNETHVALLDTETQTVTDYCIPIRGMPSVPIWSPDSTQFLVVDRYAKKHQRVILIDIVQGFAAVIAEDVEPVGWMVALEK
ncbi:MAG: hypothetical protein D6755_09330 [Anaerolineae bacterium]|nr:MAG: hypothetical protein D6755_09330 [Anaerolineae bacterium]